jgi:ferric-dicitrate binding protein FerR (iron transport regulator)
MNENLNWELLAKYLSDECSSLEKNEIETWISADPKNQHLLEVLKISWNIPEPNLQTSDTNDLWKQIEARAELDTRTAKEVNLLPQKLNNDKTLWPDLFRLAQSPVWRYAAVLLLFLFSALYIFSDDFSSLFNFGSQDELITISVPNSQRETITLNDGSVITLDAGTKFSYSEKFSKDKREVFLIGEAFFEVASIPGQPFIVYANQSAIEVVGTKFNIRAWQQERKMTVTVSEGKVLLHPDNQESETSIALNPGYASTLPLGGIPTKPRPVDVTITTGWMQNQAYFEDTPLDDILSQLERWYDITFEIQNSEVLEDRLTLFLMNKPLEEQLGLIEELVSVRFIQSGKIYQIVSES